MAIYLKQIHTSPEARCETFEDIEAYLLDLADTVTETVDVDIALDQRHYFLRKPFVLNVDEHPGLSRLRIHLHNKDGMRPMVSSMTYLRSADFEQVSEGVYRYRFEKDETGAYPVFRALFDHDARVPIARSATVNHPFRYPNPADKTDPANYKGLWVPYAEAERLAKAERVDPAEMTILLEWEFLTLQIDRVDLSETCEHAGVTYARMHFKKEMYENAMMDKHVCIDYNNREMFFANHEIYLTPNSYSYDYRTGELLVCLPEGGSIENCAFSYARLENLFILRGLGGFTLENLTLLGADSFYICKNGYYSGQANNVKRVGKLKHAAIHASNMTDMTVRGCTFRSLGGNGLLLTDRTLRATITDCLFDDISMTALSVGNSTTEWERPENQNYDVTIDNNEFKTIGYQYPTAIAVYIGQCDGLRITHNTIDHTAYSAISAGWGWTQVGWSLGEKINLRAAEIAYNRILQYMDVLRDGAAIYVVGANCRKETAGQFNFMHDNYAERDTVQRAKQGYYLDGSSSNWAVYDNVTHGADLHVFSQFNVVGQLTWHNHIERIYATSPISRGNHNPHRDTLLGECFVVEGTVEELFAAYPVARAIYEASGKK